MAVLDIRDLSCRLGTFHLDGVNLTIQKNEYLVILGPTGAGKTVFLETVLGLCKPDSGSLFIHSMDVSSLLPEQRNIGYIPQDYALFPNMSVEENIGYGPAIRKQPRKSIDDTVTELMTMLEIQHLRGRYPENLSGGEKQRVAVGRALAVEPKVLFLDEPLSALDETRRSELAKEFRSIQRKSGATFVHVCHNLDEACEVADRVAIMSAGKIVQVGSVDEILYNPVCTFTARFTGAKNILSGTFSDDCRSFLLKNGLQISLGSAVGCDSFSERWMVIRPEHIIPLADTTESQEAGTVIEGVIERISRKVLVIDIQLKIKNDDGDLPLHVSVPATAETRVLQEGQTLKVVLPEKNIRLVGAPVSQESALEPGS